MTLDDALELINRWKEDKALVSVHLISHLCVCDIHGLITDVSIDNVQIESDHGFLGASMKADTYVYDDLTSVGSSHEATLTLIYDSGEFCGIQKMKRPFQEPDSQ